MGLDETDDRKSSPSFLLSIEFFIIADSDPISQY